MADQSPFTLEERIVTSTCVHERYNTGDTQNKISVKFENRFKKNLPTRKTISRWECKMFETGNVQSGTFFGKNALRKN